MPGTVEQDQDLLKMWPHMTRDELSSQCVALYAQLAEKHLGACRHHVAGSVSGPQLTFAFDQLPHLHVHGYDRIYVAMCRALHKLPVRS